MDPYNRIIKGFSTDFEDPQESDICINEEGGRHFEMCGKINPNLVNEKGIYLYKYENGEVVPRTEEEINIDTAALPTPPKTELEIMKETLDIIVASML